MVQSHRSCSGIHRQSPHQLHSRRLWVEPLEARCLLAVVTVDTNLDVVDFNDGVTSLREAIFATNLVGGADVIDFEGALTGQTISLTMGELAISDALSIDASGLDSGLTIDVSSSDFTPDEDFGDGSRIFNIDDGNDVVAINVELVGLTLTGGDVTGGGGAVLARENFVLLDSLVVDNAATDIGGGVYVAGEITALIDESSFLGNRSGENGGGFATQVMNASVIVTSSSFTENFATDDGGGVYVRATGGVTDLVDLDVQLNEASGSGIFGPAGGGLFGWIDGAGEFAIRGSTVSGNTTHGSNATGGGIEIVARKASIIAIADSSIFANSASGMVADAGGISIIGETQSTITIEGSEISNNTVTGSGGFGGGVALTLNTGAEAAISRSRISDNSVASADGGASPCLAASLPSPTARSAATAHSAAWATAVPSMARMPIWKSSTAPFRVTRPVAMAVGWNGSAAA
jgi:hypothetical protein